eukprot:JP446787.1.p1 GENE.JP446787.1~~JP446787.1.p1  ORF type:complete len:215 (+),score=94.14 JP446787.1:49-693(+)
MASYSLPDLPYGYGALEPYIDTDTMNLHHTKHHQAYITNLNKIIEGNAALKGMSLEDICQNVATVDIPDAARTGLRNHGGGHFNHSMFWQVMSPVGDSNVAPGSELKAAIDAQFGSMDEMKNKFNAAAASVFGSGWAWLGVKDNGELTITSTPNQDNPLMSGVAKEMCKPVLGLDVWEHAYYLKYQNRRPEYIAAWWSVVNWDKVTELYTAVKK